MDDLLPDFIAETTEAMAALQNDLLSWEKSPADRELLDRIFRVFHTIKGNSGFLDLTRLEALAHGAETALSKARNGSIQPSGEFVSAILAGLDAVQTILVSLAGHGGEGDADDSVVTARIEAAASATPADSPPAANARPDEPAPSAPMAAPAPAVTTVRVKIELLDKLMAIASELVLARNALLVSQRGDDATYSNPLLDRLSTCVTDIQEGISQTRMQPIEALWGPLPRMVRDLAAELGKDVELKLAGGDTELDRQLMEALRDPLSHMIRNAADHGIERPEDRIAAGKPRSGTVTVGARQSGNEIIIDLIDDGRGIDTEKLVQKAVMLGVLNHADVPDRSRAEILRLIFEPGLSTAHRVTEISGRGVGMDVVRANIERIGGGIEIESQPGEGTHFIIRVPLTLTIAPALLIDVAGRRFAIPQASIGELLRIKGESALILVGDRRMVPLRGMLIPAVSMAELFELGIDDPQAERCAVIIDLPGRGRAALLVDGLAAPEEIFIKPVAPAIAEIGLFGGVTVLGDGRAVLVIDAAKCLERGGVETGVQEEAQPVVETLSEEESWLLFTAGSDVPKAISLAVVARLEDIDSATVSVAAGRTLAVQGDDVLPLILFDGSDVPLNQERLRTLIIEAGAHRVGLVIDDVIDIASGAGALLRQSSQPGLKGVTTFDGRATELVDLDWICAEGART